MYAVVETGGRQYRVNQGDTIDVEKLAGEVGDSITLTKVLMIGTDSDATIGTPLLADARVEAQIVAQKRGKKIIVFKRKRRKGYRRKQGHRQWLTALKITDIQAEGSTSDIAEAAAAPPETSDTPEAPVEIPEMSAEMPEA